ncbi:MAG: LytTR family DNA-binding domain-containing protein [Bacillota bacterium]|jgi:DNA-binding LytR/AlgR family response regulator
MVFVSEITVFGSKTSLKVIVADDDEPTRNLLGSLLETFAGVTVVGKAGTGKEMLDLVRETLPDIVFVDVKMPDLDGLSAVYRLQQEHPGVFVVFVSAHAHYAVDAFNLDAADYVMKPVSRERLGRALAKAIRFKKAPSFDSGEAVIPPPGPHAAGKSAPDYQELVFKYGHGRLVIETKEIIFIEKQRKKCVIHSRSGLYETAENLSAIQEKLDPACFFRCHKSFIINVHRVEKVIPLRDPATKMNPLRKSDGVYEVSFRNYTPKNNAKVTMRRDKFKEFCQLLKC